MPQPSWCYKVNWGILKFISVHLSKHPLKSGSMRSGAFQGQATDRFLQRRHKQKWSRATVWWDGASAAFGKHRWPFVLKLHAVLRPTLIRALSRQRPQSWPSLMASVLITVTLIARERPPFLAWQLGMRLGIWIPSMEVELSLSDWSVTSVCFPSGGLEFWYLLGKGAHVCPQKKAWNTLDMQCHRQHKETWKHAHRRCEHTIFSSRFQPDKK